MVYSAKLQDSRIAGREDHGTYIYER